MMERWWAIRQGLVAGLITEKQWLDGVTDDRTTRRVQVVLATDHDAEVQVVEKKLEAVEKGIAWEDVTCPECVTHFAVTSKWKGLEAALSREQQKVKELEDCIRGFMETERAPELIAAIKAAYLSDTDTFDPHIEQLIGMFAQLEDENRAGEQVRTMERDTLRAQLAALTVEKDARIDQIIVDHQNVCKVHADAMKRLNDKLTAAEALVKRVEWLEEGKAIAQAGTELSLTGYSDRPEWNKRVRDWLSREPK